MPDGTLSQAAPPAPRPPDAAEAAQRAEAILTPARTAFVEKGFDGASMQDLARAAGMSAGNLYHYFPSKAALIEALILRDCAAVQEDFRTIAAAPDPVAALRATIRRRVAEDCRGPDPLWAEIIATASRKPEVAAALGRMEDAITGLIARVLGLVRGLPEEEALRRYGAHARLILLIVRGAATQNPAGDGGDDALTALIVQTFDRLLDDVLAEPEDA